ARCELDSSLGQTLGFDAASRAVALELVTRLARLRDPELRRMQVVTRLLERALRLQALIFFPRTFDELLGRADRFRRLAARVGCGSFVGCALGERSGQRIEEGIGRSCQRAQLLDLHLQPFDARERLGRDGVSALELFSERQQRILQRLLVTHRHAAAPEKRCRPRLRGLRQSYRNFRSAPAAMTKAATTPRKYKRRAVRNLSIWFDTSRLTVIS
ncbi:MAG: hypothetical protein QOC79_945, partial [Actinomycetota bacterium]|nr:hypothetical protein [Actinomycetota bacterium]